MKSATMLGPLLLFAAAPAAGKDPPAPPAQGLAVHEWGVFRVSEDEAFANAALRAEWDDLPGFAYGYIKGRFVPQHWGAFEVRKKPIIFFHADGLAHVQVKVDFPGGMAGVWFPATESPAVYGDQKQPKVGGSLVWDIGVKQCPHGWQPKAPAPPEVSAKHWVSRVRQVRCDEVFAKYSPNPNDVEREKFVFYDGLFPQAKWVKVEVGKERVSLTSRVKHAVFDVTVVDRRADGKVRVGRVAKLDAGAVVTGLKFTEVDASQFASEASDTLVKQLVGAGLFEDEARSLVDLWRKEMFEAPGVCAFYRIPQSEYDRAMPLTVTPKLAAVARVGLIYHGHLEPDFAERVWELVKKFDSNVFAEREAAPKKLLAIGPAALVQLKRVRERKDLSVEVRERLDALVKKWDAGQAFDR